MLDLGNFVLVRRGDKILIVDVLGKESGEHSLKYFNDAVAALVAKNY